MTVAMSELTPRDDLNRDEIIQKLAEKQSEMQTKAEETSRGGYHSKFLEAFAGAYHEIWFQLERNDKPLSETLEMAVEYHADAVKEEQISIVFW